MVRTRPSAEEFATRFAPRRFAHPTVTSLALVQLAQRMPNDSDQGWHRIGLGKPSERPSRLRTIADLHVVMSGGKDAADAVRRKQLERGIDPVAPPAQPDIHHHERRPF